MPALVGPPLLCSRQVEPEYYQSQYTLINREGRLRFAAVLRHTFHLPPEILAEIFLHCLPQAGFPSPTTAPLVLCGVCRRWRDVAIGTSALWSSLSIDFDRMSNPGPMTDPNPVYQTWLSRARGAPLSLLLQQEDFDGYVAIDDREALARSVVELSGQWRSIQVGVRQDLANALFPITETYPLLEDLNISPPDHQDNLAISIFHAPQLREVTISRYNMHIQLPWHQLTTLGCYRASIPSYLDILSPSPKVSEARKPPKSRLKAPQVLSSLNKPVRQGLFTH
ncbi:hypothetical protein DFH06DRAFT_49472 [Mycena polygramma]|nr:hypothetical protein DFH06DRAFT_49472 [Mycena polygramma]